VGRHSSGELAVSAARTCSNRIVSVVPERMGSEAPVAYSRPEGSWREPCNLFMAWAERSVSFIS
jgi:hypothetical protein